MFTKRETGTIKRETGTIKRATQTGPIIEQPSYTEFAASVITNTFQARGKLQSMGTLQTFLNDDQKTTLTVYNAELIGLEPTNPATRITPAELVVRKAACSLIAFDVRPPADQLMPLSHVESLVIYTDRFAIQGKFHMGPDARINDFADAGLQQFIVASDARIYPLFQTRGGLIQSAPIICIQRASISIYHKV